MGKASLTIAISGSYDGKALKKAEQDLQKMGIAAAREMGGVTGSIASFGDSLTGVGKDVTSFGKGVEDMGVKISKLTAPLAIAGTAALKLASDYEDSVAKVYTIMDKSVVGTDEMAESILDLSTATGRSATELADATYQALSASVSTDKVAGFVADAVQLSKVGFTDTATAVDTLTTVINAYGYSADDAQMIMGRLVQTQNKGKTTVNELAQSMGNVIPTASAYNVSLDNLSSAYVIMTKQGINTANATTAINGMLTELADSGSDVAQVLQTKTGKSFGQLMADGMDLGEVIQILSDSVDGDSEAFANLWGNVRASKGALAIANAGSEQFTQAMNDMADSAGLVESALQDLQTPSALANRALNSVKNTGIKLGQEMLRAAVPTLEKLVDKAQDLYEWFSNLDDGTKQNIVRFGALATAAGPVLVVVGKLAQGLGGMLTTLGVNVSKVAAFSGAMRTAEAEMRAAGATSVSLGSKMSAAASKTGLLTNATSMLKGGLAALGIAAAVAAIGLIVTKVQEWKKYNDDVTKSTDGLREAVNASKTAYDDTLGSIDASSAALEANAKSAKQCIEDQSELAGKLTERWSEVGENSALVDIYAQRIQELGQKGELTAEEQALLADAVSNFNELTGSSVGIVNAQTGELNMEYDAIMKTAEAYRQRAQAQAAQELMVDIQKQIYENDLAIAAAEQELTRQQELYNEAVMSGDTAASDYYLTTISAAQGELDDLKAAQESAQQTLEQYAGIVAESVPKFDNFDQALQVCGTSIEDLGEISEEELNSMRGDFDGSLNSIVQSCTKNGRRIPEGVASGIRKSSGLPEGEANAMFDAMVLQMTNGDLEAAAELLGHDIDAGLLAGIEGSADMPESAVGVLSDDVIARAREALQTHSPSRVFKQIGSDIDAGMKQGIEGGKGSVTGAMGTLSTAVQDAVKGLPDKLKKIGTDGSSKFASGVGSAESTTKTNAGKLADAAETGATPAKTKLDTLGKQAGGKFSSGIGAVDASGSGRALAQTAIDGVDEKNRPAYDHGVILGKSAKSGAGDVSLYNEGLNLGGGLISGMSDSDVYTAAEKMSSRIKQVVKNMFGINSPSKVFAYYGEMLGAGLAAGMEAQEGAIQAEAERYGELTALDPSGEVAYSATSTVAAGALGAASGASAPVFNINVTVNGAVDAEQAREAGAEMGEAAYQQWQRYRRAVA